MLISGQTIIESYCILRQSERGIDAAARESWSDFRSYYSDDLKERISRLISNLQSVHAKSVVRHDRHYKINPWRRLLFFSNRYGRKHRISGELVAQIEKCIVEFVSYLSDHKKPAQGVCGQYMQKAAHLRSTIEIELYGMRWLKRANNVDHYFRNPVLTTYSIEEILNGYRQSKTCSK